MKNSLGLLLGLALSACAPQIFEAVASGTSSRCRLLASGR
jgi:hypothetical protein